MTPHAQILKHKEGGMMLVWYADSSTLSKPLLAVTYRMYILMIFRPVRMYFLYSEKNIIIDALSEIL